MTISNELLDELLKDCKRAEDLLGDAGLMKELKIRLMERMLGGELTAHLGYEVGAEPPAEQTNRRNGFATKRVQGSDGEVPLSVPRDREGSFEPELVKKGQTRIDGIDDKIILHSPSGVSFEVKIACIRALDKDFLPQAAPAVAQTAGSGRIRPRSRCFLAQGRRFSAQRTDLSSRFRSV